jgi:hypothetical protein
MSPIDKKYLDRLRKMKPGKRVLLAIQLTELVRQIAVAGIKSSGPGLKKAAVLRKLRERIYG